MVSMVRNNTIRSKVGFKSSTFLSFIPSMGPIFLSVIVDKDSFETTTGMICFWNLVNKIYTNFLISFGIDFFISFRTLLITEWFISVGYLFLYIFYWFIFKTSTFDPTDFIFYMILLSSVINSRVFFIGQLNFYSVNFNRTHSFSFLYYFFTLVSNHLDIL